MRTILAAIAIVIVVVVVLLALNWMQVDSSDGRTTITIDTGKVEEVGDKLESEGREALRETGEALQRAGERDDEGNPPR